MSIRRRPSLRAPGLQHNTIPSLEALVPESAFQAQIMQMASDTGWLVHHTFDSRRTEGKGFPDLVMVRAPDVVFCELKKIGRYPDRDQRRWLSELEGVTDLHVRVWRPTSENWSEIEELLWRGRK